MDRLVDFLVFWFSCYGGSNGIVFSRLLLPLRLWIQYSKYEFNHAGLIHNQVERTSRIFKFFSKLINCPLCMGFWLGVIMSLFVVNPSGSSNPIGMLFNGFLGSAASWITHLLFADKMDGK
tara:strand:+ start:9310 stop:9672 length:363 start_codon:yes stop_codon:yes gene_type:complete